jgi:hypothetical protein
MKKSVPTKAKEFKRVLGNLLKAPPKLQSEIKVGKKREASEPASRPNSRQKVGKNRSSPKAGG